MSAETGNYAALSARISQRARAARLPTNGTIELTHRCPLACKHCYNNLPVGDSEARRRELSTDELRRIIDEIADAATNGHDDGLVVDAAAHESVGLPGRSSGSGRA